MSLDEYEYETIQATTLIMKKLDDEDAAHVLWLLTAWANALGFAQGMNEALKLLQEKGK